jgi:hypothetical protein
MFLLSQRFLPQRFLLCPDSTLSVRDLLFSGLTPNTQLSPTLPIMEMNKKTEIQPAQRSRAIPFQHFSISAFQLLPITFSISAFQLLPITFSFSAFLLSAADNGDE